MLDRKIILASQSPRRKQLLTQAGIPFEIKVAPIDEVFPDDMDVREVAPYLAKEKAKAAAHFIESDEIVLAADSVVILGQQLFGKPKSYDDAYMMLRTLSGQMHEVITGVCLLGAHKERVFSSLSKVYMEELSDREIDFYIQTFEPYDKAGAYAIQEWMGLCKVNRIEGTYANIMGLPVDLVYQELMVF